MQDVRFVDLPDMRVVSALGFGESPEAFAVEIDGNGSAYVTGFTDYYWGGNYSTGGFPTTSGAYVESATGIREGARTGLAAVTTAGWFAIALFFIPVSFRRGEYAVDWKTARKLPWDMLLLFG